MAICGCGVQVAAQSLQWLRLGMAGPVDVFEPSEGIEQIHVAVTAEVSNTDQGRSLHAGQTVDVHRFSALEMPMDQLDRFDQFRDLEAAAITAVGQGHSRATKLRPYLCWQGSLRLATKRNDGLNALDLECAQPGLTGQGSHR